MYKDQKQRQKKMNAQVKKLAKAQKKIQQTMQHSRFFQQIHTKNSDDSPGDGTENATGVIQKKKSSLQLAEPVCYDTRQLPVDLLETYLLV